MIRFSKKEDYAIVIAGTLAHAYNKRLVPLSEIAHEYEISALFLRNLAVELREAGVIRAVEGKNGGYYLTRSPSEMKMGEILEIFAKRSAIRCSRPIPGGVNAPCPHERYCLAGNTWRALNREFMDKVYGMTLQAFLSYSQPSNKLTLD